MQVKLLEDSGNISVEKEESSESYQIMIDSRVSIRVTRTELKLLHAIIGSLLQENPKANRDNLKKVLAEAMVSHKGKIQDALRRMKQEDIAYAVWYTGDLRITQEILRNMSKRSADDIQEAVRESIERRIRKERSTGNSSYEAQVEEYGKNAVITLLKMVYDSETLPL